MELNNEKKEALIDLLAVVYMQIDWGKMNTSKNPWDIFNHRVRAATRKKTIGEFTSKLCNYFGLQSLPLEANDFIKTIESNQDTVLNTLHSEHIPFCMRAIKKAKEIKKERKLKKESGNV